MPEHASKQYDLDLGSIRSRVLLGSVLGHWRCSLSGPAQPNRPVM
jgi:hypothetical protein